MASPSGPNPLIQRREYLIKEINAFIEMTGREKRASRVEIEAVPRLWDRNRRAVYTLRVRGELLPPEWVEKLRDIVGRARSLLDNAMWTAAGGDRPGAYTSREQDQIKFPVAHTSDDWANFEARKHALALSRSTRSQLREMQPFVTARPVIRWLNRTNNVDKHRYPLRLAIVPDALFVMPLNPAIAGSPGRDHNGFRWQPLKPVEHGKKLLEYRHPSALHGLLPVEVPVALCVDVDGQWVDVQDFLWDTVELVARASAILTDGDTTWADFHRALFDAEREQLGNFRRMMVDEDPLAKMAWLATGNLRAGLTDGSGPSSDDLP
jgi:hypothetical protein